MKKQKYQISYNNAISINLKSDYFIQSYKNTPDLSIIGIALDKEIINKGDKVNVIINSNSLERNYNTYYIANIFYINKRNALIKEFEENDTTLFILPLLDLPSKLLLLQSNFINGYLQVKGEYNEIGDCVHLVYRYMPFIQYSKLIDILKKQKGFISIIKSKDRRFDILKFEIKNNYKQYVIQLINGDYSKLPEFIKNKIIKFKNRKKQDIIYQTLFNSEDLREKLAKELMVKISDLPLELREQFNIPKEKFKL